MTRLIPCPVCGTVEAVEGQLCDGCSVPHEGPECCLYPGSGYPKMCRSRSVAPKPQATSETTHGDLHSLVSSLAASANVWLAVHDNPSSESSRKNAADVLRLCAARVAVELGAKVSAAKTGADKHERLSRLEQVVNPGGGEFANIATERNANQDARDLIRRAVKYIVEDRAVTPGKTRLARWREDAVAFLAEDSGAADGPKTSSSTVQLECEKPARARRATSCGDCASNQAGNGTSSVAIREPSAASDYDLHALTHELVDSLAGIDVHSSDLAKLERIRFAIIAARKAVGWAEASEIARADAGRKHG